MAHSHRRSAALGARLTALPLLILLAAGACASGRKGRRTPEPSPAARRGLNLAADSRELFERMGLLASTAPIPFVGTVGYFAGPSADSTIALVTISLQNHWLTFKRDANDYAARYQVSLDLRRGEEMPTRLDAHETIRVATFRETLRTDESVIFQQFVRVEPGEYTLTVSVRDEEGARSSGEEAKITIPRLGEGQVAKPMVVYEAAPRAARDSLPRLAPSPRSTAIFGRDSTLVVYLEAYGSGASLPIEVSAKSDRGTTLWTHAAQLTGRGTLFSGSLVVPVAEIGIGVTTLAIVRQDTKDSSSTPVFVNFGEDLPVATFDEMIDYLRYFAPSERLKSLRDTTPEGRVRAWAAFVRETDPNPATPQHEGLTQYFQRIQQSNERFREEGIPGWLTDRGMVYATLGEPEQVYQEGAGESTLRKTQIWEYRQYRLQLVFQDQNGFGRWKLTTRSESDFQLVARQVMSRGR